MSRSVSRHGRNVHARSIIGRVRYADRGSTMPLQSDDPTLPKAPQLIAYDLQTGPPIRHVNPYALPSQVPSVTSPVPPGNQGLVFGRGVKMPDGSKNDV